MRVYTALIGNMATPEWRDRLKNFHIEYVTLDPWTAQKSRFVARSDHDREVAITLDRHVRIADGDIIEYLPERKQAVVLKVMLQDVLVVNMSALIALSAEEAMQTALELGHALGNQHWPAVVKGLKVFVPITVDKKVMDSVMRTHNIEGVSYEFQSGQQVIPYLAPHEIRRLFGGVSVGHEHHHLKEQA